MVGDCKPRTRDGEGEVNRSPAEDWAPGTLGEGATEESLSEPRCLSLLREGPEEMLHTGLGAASVGT